MTPEQLERLGNFVHNVVCHAEGRAIPACLLLRNRAHPGPVLGKDALRAVEILEADERRRGRSESSHRRQLRELRLSLRKLLGWPPRWPAVADVGEALSEANRALMHPDGGPGQMRLCVQKNGAWWCLLSEPPPEPDSFHADINVPGARGFKPRDAARELIRKVREQAGDT